MKKILTFSAVAIFSIAVVSGCSKSSSSSPAGSMTATIGNATYNLANCKASLNGDEVAITANNNWDYPYMILQWASNSISTGTFFFADSTSKNIAEYFIYPDYVVAVSGSVTVTSVSPNVAGTFSFICYNGTWVHNGIFIAEIN